MDELLATLMNYLRGIWRYRWYAMSVAWVVAVVGWIMVARMPDEYRASARVFADTDSILRPLLRGIAIESNVQQRLQMMTRTLLSRPNLEKVVRAADLDLVAKSDAEMETLLSRLAGNIRLGSTRRENLYTITYTDTDPEVAKRVVQATLNVLIETTLGDSRQQTDVAQKFLDEQIKEYEAKLVEAENRLKEFKRRYQGIMVSGQSYFQRLERATAQLQEARLELREAEQRLAALRGQLMGEEPVFGFAGRPWSRDNPARVTAPSARRGDGGGAFPASDPQILALEEELQTLLLRYTDQHPDVITLRNSIETLKKRQAERQAAEPEVVIEEPEPVEEPRNLAENPVYQQIKIAAGQAEAEVASLRVRVQEYESRVADLKHSIDTVPEIEAQLTRLNRDYAIHKANYDDLVKRRETARISESVDQTGESVRFKVIDPPRVPSKPVGPNRMLFDSFALVAGLGLGVAVAFLLSQLRPAVYDVSALRALSDFPVFGSISRVWTPELLMRRRLELGAYLIAAGGLLLIYVGVLFVVSGQGPGGALFAAMRNLL
ncbi:MAG TPA: chain-length determining protein [Thiotrichales bacterium]|nr:chain-length determining protein [Thiotrichales bacterium]